MTRSEVRTSRRDISLTLLMLFPQMWHRVDYNGGRGDASSSAKLSIGASIFHFEPLLYVANFPFFSYLIIPNLVQEVLGFNTE